MLSSWELLDTAKCTALWDTNKPMEHCDGCVFWCMHVFFLSFVSSCPTIQLGGGEIQSVLILVSSCKFVCSPAFTPLCSPLVLFSKGNIWLGRPPASTASPSFLWCFVLLFILPVPLITPDQATNYCCWHEPPCNLKSTSLLLFCSFSLPSVISFITFYSALLSSTPPLPLQYLSIWAFPLLHLLLIRNVWVLHIMTTALLEWVVRRPEVALRTSVLCEWMF